MAPKFLEKKKTLFLFFAKLKGRKLNKRQIELFIEGYNLLCPKYI